MENLHKCQFDFIKVKSQKVNRESVNWEMLNEHPTIKNAYTLDAKSGLHGKNFKLYFTKGDYVVLETSIPYLVYGHNYVQVSGHDLVATFLRLKELLRIDFINAHVLQFEYGGFMTKGIEAKDYIKNIIDVSSYDLKFSSPFMKMYGNSSTNFKIYDAVANARKKKTFTRGNYPNGKLIKFEVKVLNAQRSFQREILVIDLCRPEIFEPIITGLNFHISMITELRALIDFKTNTNSLNDILFNCLKHLQNQFGYPIYELVIGLINDLDLSPSQKSKRRKSFIALEEKFKLTQANSN
tara:strand:- start:1698 stop:2585 length:888 start_codon:yes stop_codon:yes gene_type:complete